jgi:NADH-quinone oxidoreductase subunit C
VFVETSDDFKQATAWLVNEGVTQIAAITGIDQGETIEILHHMTHGGYVISLRSHVSKAAPAMPSLIDLVPGSAIFEREVHDLFGVTFHGNPDLSPLLLPDGWPSDVYPMRSEWTSEALRQRLEER